MHRHVYRHVGMGHVYGLVDRHVYRYALSGDDISHRDRAFEFAVHVIWLPIINILNDKD